MKCSYGKCRVDATKDFALVPLCEFHHAHITKETRKFYSGKILKEDRRMYKSIQHLVPFRKEGA